MGDSDVPTAMCGCSSIASYVGESKQCGTKKLYCIRQWSKYKVKEGRIRGEGVRQEAPITRKQQGWRSI
ncbi:hypothetical protein K443DRAFT_445849 [Laccaria amethystina LaAM-08-1]|uniref:Uncharacterized protein n=1 Tax=Laccaria amethystina LaAM-08-1 TaxID=1095629 RepID=A0A0C9XA08_9AGAR|nr:hypothetical protein K443DRAFT_445849 [Laccaria amethystina LaAM-08-1]